MTLSVKDLLTLHWLPVPTPYKDFPHPRSNFREIIVWTPAHHDPQRRTLTYVTDQLNHYIVAKDAAEHTVQVWKVITDL